MLPTCLRRREQSTVAVAWLSTLLLVRAATGQSDLQQGSRRAPTALQLRRGENCEDLAVTDLQHLTARASARCARDAQRHYCERVRAAERAERGLLPAGKPSELCPASRPAKDVTMRLEAPKRAIVAYLILCYDQLQQVQRLVRRIYDPEHSLVLLHVDVKIASEALLTSLRGWAARLFFGGVQIFSEFQVHRGGRSMLDVHLRAFELLLEQPWDFFINLSDTHYPTESMAVMGSYLWLYRGTNFARITSTKYYDPTLQGGQGATYAGPRRDDLFVACDRSLAFECEGRLYSLTPGVKYPPVLSGITAASGPEWVVLGRAFVAYIHQGLAQLGSLVQALYEDLASLSIPEETFFQTLLLSSSYCHSVLRHEFLYLNLYDAPWRTSAASDFPFQTPWPLNTSHLFEIGKEDPWFIRKLQASDGPSATALRTALDATVAARSARVATSGVADLDVPAGLRRAVRAELGFEVEAAKRRLRPRHLQASLLTPTVWEISMHRPCERVSALELRNCRRKATLPLVERVAVPVEPPAPVVALRVGCGWNETAYEFLGEVSVVSAEDCEVLTLVAYVTNSGFEGSISILWSVEGVPVRRSGGQIPRGFAMFVDRVALAPGARLTPGRWRVELSDDKGSAFGSRDALVYEGSGSWPSLEDYVEFFQFASP